jgi:hypothetical protein
MLNSRYLRAGLTCVAASGLLAVGGAAYAAASPHVSQASIGYKYTFYRVEPSALTVQPDSVAQGFALCKTGDKATGGGFQITNTSTVTVEASNSSGTPPAGWEVVVFNNDSEAHNFSVEVECVHRG